MIGIFYFSSTGNSLQIAKQTKEKLGGKIIYIPSYQGDGSEFDKIIVVTPIHSYGLPALVYDFLPNLDKSKPLIILLNYGGMVAGADYFTYSYAKDLGLNIIHISTIKMPENFTLYLTVPKYITNRVLKTSTKRIDKILEDIKNETYSLPKKKKTKTEKYNKNKSNWHLIGNDFKANSNCTKCQKCVNLCPTHNISMVDGKIVFGDKCVACLGCYHRCPNKAIEFKNKKKKYRYTNPYINEDEIGKNQ